MVPQVGENGDEWHRAPGYFHLGIIAFELVADTCDLKRHLRLAAKRNIILTRYTPELPFLRGERESVCVWGQTAYSKMSLSCVKTSRKMRKRMKFSVRENRQIARLR